tara:strand:- start:423 stop:638 length:216 start_codon:yes stop_codon:yes gene_type:complete
MKNITIAAITGWVLVIALTAFAANATLNALSIPDVMFSHSTDECVEVFNYVEGENYSCENLPSKFNHVWVK